MKFKCPSCDMQLKAEPEMAGKVVRCPGCNTKLQIPADVGLPPPATEGAPPPPDGEPSTSAPDSPPADHGQEDLSYDKSRAQRGGWEETDPANPNIWLALSIGAVATAAWYGIVFALSPDSYLRGLFANRGWVNYMETFFFFWAIGILYLKGQKLRHQKTALYLDVLPVEIGNEVNAQNVPHFIDNLYALPGRLRDSLMVNRIRKGLELFEARQNNGEVATMMSAQSDIDSNRIGGSYSLLKVFLWAIPILGFIGTVLGLSQAIGSIQLDVEDISKVLGSIGNVTSGLGTAFDTTLLGLVLALLLNFPMNALMKAEDDNLNNIDAFCNEVLMPRLNDGGGIAGGDTGGLMDTLVKAVASSQSEFLKDLNVLSKKMNDYAMNLDRRVDSHQELVHKEFTDGMHRLREDLTAAVKDSVKVTTDYTRALSTGIQSLNNLLKELGEKQVVIHQVKKKGWFSRG
ncbi:MAG: MotA/TolQ/ExbB proton channel family protein [Verrucomicrobiales bacterium]|nr:MotA/TolQ/ExbB proton channel family protein [Verrucomicrobiales bacterium]